MSTTGVLILVAGLASTVSAQPEDAVSIHVDGTAEGAPLEPIWSYFGYDEANYTTMAEGEELLRALSAVNPAPPYVRTHFLFNTGDGTPMLKWGSTNIYTEDDTGTPVYDYTLIDQIMDATVNAGALPLFQFGFMPRALSTQPDPYQNSNTYVLDGGCFHPPNDYDNWAALVQAWAGHVKDRYPDAESRWQWELWNEPDIAYWQGTFDEFTRLYDVTEAALHAVLPDASLGGPAVANVRNEFLAQFLEHCENGVNAVTGESGTRLDMVSFHGKGGVSLVDDHVQMDLGNQLRLHRLGFETVSASAFSETPIVISEADPDGCAACPISTAPHHAYRNSPAYGAYEVAMMKRTLDLARDAGVNLRGVVTWAFTFPGTPYFAGYRALSTNGIRLPVFNAFELLASLRGNRLPSTSSGALPMSEVLESGVRAQPDVDALASTDGERIQVLVWNYHDDLVDADPEPVVLRISVPPAFEAAVAVRHTRVDAEHGNAYAVWKAQGSPQTPSAAQLAELRDSMQPAALEQRVVPVDDGEVELEFQLPRFGLSLLSLEPSADTFAPHPPDDDASQAGNEAGGESGCSCRITQAPSSSSALFALVTALACYWRRSRLAQ